MQGKLRQAVQCDSCSELLLAGIGIAEGSRGFLKQGHHTDTFPALQPSSAPRASNSHFPPDLNRGYTEIGSVAILTS
jgi:hypothetical protein